MREGRRRRLVVLALIFAGLFLGIGASVALPLWTGRARYPDLERQVARRAIDEARRRSADRWAPDRFASAETAFKVGVDEGLRQRARLIPFRNFAHARDSFYCAGQNARRAAVLGIEARNNLARRAVEALGRAEEAVEEAGACVRLVPVGLLSRTRLQRARSLLSEARAFQRAREFDHTVSRASEAHNEALRVLDATRSMASRYLDVGTIRQWQAWVDETVAESRSRSTAAIIVFKEKNRLDLYQSGRLVRSYHADMGKNRLSRKLVAGDRATPEGRYSITKKKGRGNSKYYMALVLNYPNEADRRRLAQAKNSGLASGRASPGSLIEIHGEGGRGEDWTLGCVALSNRDLDDLFARVSVGTPVTIVGGDGQNGKFSDLARRLSAPPQ